MWSVGCILAELLSMQQENVKDHTAREPLFPGHYSDMTPRKQSRKPDISAKHARDQLQVIFDVIGTPSTSEILNVRKQQAELYLRSLPKQKGVDYKEKFPGIKQDAFDLLTALLQFDPANRLTVDQALNHKFLEAVREKLKEKEASEVTFEFEDIHLSEDQIRDMIIKEMTIINKYPKIES
eukprot:TRINITY_DN2857_c0_g1_i1.p1 TRINITY_DN2857_c0_g1~~TRINITY_DN2857_c0_g1_i1.p1  ORF type:complete len:181 (+),score=43.38 TRINITY_DN2857_c0_g1_i1:532-1074(+)